MKRVATYIDFDTDKTHSELMYENSKWTCMLSHPRPLLTSSWITRIYSRTRSTTKGALSTFPGRPNTTSTTISAVPKAWKFSV